jgi:hypothetical protein
VRLYRIGGCVLFFIAVMLVAFGVDEAAGFSGWWRRIGILAYYSWYAVPAVFLGLKSFKAGRAFSQAFVAIGPDGVRLHLLRKKGLTYVPLREQCFKWQEIGEVVYDGRFCRFRAGSQIYTLSDENSPPPLTVAQLMAERKGVQLPSRELAVPPGKKPVPRLTQAAIMGGIGIALLGVVVAAGWWTHSHFAGPYDGPYYLAEFIALLVFGVLGLPLLGTAITFSRVEPQNLAG